MKEYADVKSFEISRATWYRGKGDANSLLLNAEGNKCCLGFYAKACGFEDEQITHAPTPCQIKNISSIKADDVWRTILLKPNKNSLSYKAISDSDIGNLLMTVNDDIYIGDAERETRIINIFATHGIEVMFKD
jgi:hypothetical protein